MQYLHDTFAEARPVKKAYSSPALTVTRLSKEELARAVSSQAEMVLLGRELKLARRI